MYIEIGIFFALLIVGLCIGSFLNVVIYRIPITLLNANEKVFNIAWPPSHCTHCGNNILKRDNIPVISWFMLRGRCRFCGSVISSRYPFVEFITGLVFSVLGTYMFFIADKNIYVISLILFLF